MCDVIYEWLPYLVSRSLIILQTEESQRSKTVVDGHKDNSLIDQIVWTVQTVVIAPNAKRSTLPQKHFLQVTNTETWATNVTETAVFDFYIDSLM